MSLALMVKDGWTVLVKGRDGTEFFATVPADRFAESVAGYAFFETRAEARALVDSLAAKRFKAKAVRGALALSVTEPTRTTYIVGGKKR